MEQVGTWFGDQSQRPDRAFVRRLSTAMFAVQAEQGASMTADNTVATIAGTEIRYLNSRHVGDEFKLFIAHPVFPVPTGQKVPVIYALDPNGAFGTVVETARLLQMPGETPNCFVVGIGYRKGALIDTLGIRARDYTPTRSAIFEDVFQKAMSLPEPVISGGGPAFLRFIREELKPYIEAEFPVDPGNATVTGASFGGLFQTFALLNEPSTFQRYIICSPSLFYDNEIMFRQEGAYAAKHTDLPARIFMTCGMLENLAGMEASYAKYPPSVKKNFLRLGKLGMIEFIEPFVAQLRARRYPSLRLSVHFFADEHHNSVYPAAVSRGLRTVFAP
jgi:predicted alpha/beta superfamily hydrolase